VREELRDEEYNHFLVPHQLVNKHFPVLVVIVVNEQMLHLAKVAPFLFVALHEFVLQGLNVWHHLIGLEYTYVVDPSFRLELAYLGVDVCHSINNHKKPSVFVMSNSLDPEFKDWSCEHLILDKYHREFITKDC